MIHQGFEGRLFVHLSTVILLLCIVLPQNKNDRTLNIYALYACNLLYCFRF